MAENIQLNDQEKLELMEAINSGKNPPSHLATKLFPHLQDTFDVKSLKNAKIPLLQYEGKRTKAQILAGADSVTGAGPLQVVREFGEAEDDEWRNLIIQGDNLQFLKTCYKNDDPLIKDKVKGKVKLIYIDPPFATKSDFGGTSGERSYQDKIDQSEFLEAMRERLYFMKELLSEDGSIFVHLDGKMTHYIKIIMDELFGKENFVNSITWQRAHAHGDSGQGSKHFGRVTESLLYYVNNFERSYWEPQYNAYTTEILGRDYKYTEIDGRKYRLAPVDGPGGASKGNPYYEFLGVKGYWRFSKERMQKMYDDGLVVISKSGKSLSQKKYLDNAKGTPVTDLWSDINRISPTSNEKVDYPTQKPEALLKRIINTASGKDDLVVDLFAGSGTSAAVAEKLGRRWISADFGKHAIYTQQKRILRISESKTLDKDATGNYGKEPKPFAVASVGAYDFSKIMKLSEHKDLYINFVLQLFHIARDDAKAQDKFKLANIYALKDNHPVEVYPVWDEEYLKEIRIDEAYLQDILDASGGKLRGEYYIITPETCTNISDTKLKNAAGQDIEFKLLKFPYKIIEEISRHAQLQEQPSSSDNINDLVTSTAFYFNENVEVNAVRTASGIKINHFDSNIFDNNGKRYMGIDGLAMVLIDKNYEPRKPFDMEQAVYRKEINADGEMKVQSLTDSVAIIAIDKHGNESKPSVVGA